MGSPTLPFVLVQGKLIRFRSDNCGPPPHLVRVRVPSPDRQRSKKSCSFPHARERFESGGGGRGFGGMEPRVGNKFRLGRKIGSGSFGEIYLGVSTCRVVCSTTEITSTTRAAMDWFSWLSNSGLDPSIVCQYALLFASNELEEEDIAYFDHGFLQSMGITIAKHRLEILKLINHRVRVSSPLPAAKLVSVIRNSKTCFANYIRSMMMRRNRAADPTILVVPKASYGGNGGDQWRGSMLKRKTKLALLKQGRVMIADRGVTVKALHRPPSHSSSPMVHSCADDDHDDDGDGYWESAAGEATWDTMFQDLKPT
ncbi:hypothetical protein ZIOFF_040495 [Zingiber officinale]|uniref:SAM domain-containing protein n=1 Tax=Zingiber officinale TaxID=94328 RepID=A0A8J5GCL5_ZINOF|nr:hypothetical protein ZIOFF_040495 [Zingiber officinale]